ncbi:MAG: peptidoglycan-binding domain-containing protein, partial [Microcoleus sp.]
CHEPERNPHKPHQRILKHGARGEDVKRLQKVLNARGLCPEPIVLDGVFGPTTLTAVKKFQRQANLRADGVVGAETWDKLLASASH